MFTIKRSLILLFFGVATFTASAVSPLPKQPDAVALSVGLFNQDTPKEVEEYGKYYHLQELGLTDNECEFSTKDGSRLVFQFGQDETKQVVLSTKQLKKEVVKALEECQFEKVKDVPEKYKGMNVYEKKGSSFASIRTICIFKNSSPLTLTFLKEKK